MTLKTLLDPTKPLFQAPMAGGITSPALVAAVAQAGAVGSFGFAYSTPETIAADLDAVRTVGRVNANFFVFEDVSMPEGEAATAALDALRQAAPGCIPTVPELPFFPDLAAQLEPVWAMKPDILTFHFGTPAPDILARARSLGILTGVTATSLAEAQAIVEAGADFVVAQGSEAGGHRGTFDAQGENDQNLPAAELTKRLCANLPCPVVSAGGIMTAADVSTHLQLGAVAVQCGTAFLCATEAGTHRAYRAALTQGRPTEVTTGFSGRRARALANTFTKAMRGAPVLPFPLQNTATGPMRKRASSTNDAEQMSLWAGTGHAQLTHKPAADIVADLCRELVI